MLFTDFHFLFLFLPLVLVAVWCLPSKRQRLALLTVASYIFYGAWNYKFVTLLFLSTGLDFCAGLLIDRTGPNRRARRAFLLVSIVCNLSILGFFKYSNFFLGDLQTLLTWLGIDVRLPLLKVILPVGISFYTFQSMSYTIDVYRGQVPATKDFLKFAAYIALFPQLVAGPVVRYKDLDEQLDHIDQPLGLDHLTVGLQIFLIGLFKKVLIADSLARMINPMFESYPGLGQLEAWMAALGYAFQIYFDFSGYSDMAIGLGRMLGLQFPYNFDSPYQAANMADFWRRWHMSLSTWLRDYLYIPLGGNRCSRKRAALNILLVFALGGLWHGAAWTFVIWGLYQGILVAGYSILKRPWDALPRVVQRSLTFVLVVIGWVFFRSENMSMALTLLAKMFRLPETGMSWSPGLIWLTRGNIILLLFVNVLANTNSFQAKRSRVAALVFAALFVLSILAINSLKIEFLYYQF
ncbi:MAG: MBOAT family protein [Planctomycetes bacterium]|nr:MBOAT family protein [Planctomycetota bacterium]